jgi:hypothetical protein
MIEQFSTVEKCILRDLIKIEIKSLDKEVDDEYLQKLLKLSKKLKLDPQQRIKMNKLYKKEFIKSKK